MCLILYKGKDVGNKVFKRGEVGIKDRQKHFRTKSTNKSTDEVIVIETLGFKRHEYEKEQVAFLALK